MNKYQLSRSDSYGSSPDPSPRKFKEIIKKKVTLTHEESKVKTVYEKMLIEVRNIENCLNYFIDVG